MVAIGHVMAVLQKILTFWLRFQVVSCIRSERDFEQKWCFWALSAARGPIWALFRGGALFCRPLGG